MKNIFLAYLVVGVLTLGGFWYFFAPSSDVVNEPTLTDQKSLNILTSERVVSDQISLPLSGSVPEVNVPHIIPISEIRRGCFKQDCIPAVDDPEFVTVETLNKILEPDSLGIALTYQGEERFYPFPMLETHELVNDTVAGEPVLVSYCPLCGTGIVFERTVGDEAVEFGVSGMLWQSNLLMYNRAESIEKQNLWSQVLGQAVVGERAGEMLAIIPSDIMRFADWSETHPKGLVLTTGTPRDPYNGEYYRVAASFLPRFDATQASLAPDTYVYGVIASGTPIAIPRSLISFGEHTYVHKGLTLSIHKSEAGVVQIYDQHGVQLADVEGFWFSWQSAYPDTEIIK